MSDATYILGTDEVVMWAIEWLTPGCAFVPADWTAVAAMVPSDAELVDEPGSFIPATLSSIDGRSYGEANLIDLGGTEAGTFHIFTRLTKTVGGTVIPLLRADGQVIIEEP